MDPFLLSELDFIQSLQGGLGGLVSLFKGITFLGNEEFYLLIIPLLYWCVDAGLGLRIGVMLIFSNVFNSALKLAFHSPRPYWVDLDVRAFSSETSFGMPSGHAQNAASLWGLAAVKMRKTWFRWLAVLLILLIGLSRMVLGVHFPSDVLVGWGVGGLLLTAYLQLEKPVTRWFNALKPQPAIHGGAGQFPGNFAERLSGLIGGKPLVAAARMGSDCSAGRPAGSN
ncbi:MAG: hypothetical protein KatS3mg046_010 [Bellilinea sp.]|nr:MAG: hypothetical protein KatS3mg046_010 [Bellilinea sp.]